MARPKLKFAWIEDRKARNIACQQRMKGLVKMAEELTILSGTRACLTFFNRDDGKSFVWPSQEEAKSLVDRYNALPENKRNMKVEDQEAYIKASIKKMENKLERSRKVITELEMDHLMFQLQKGGNLADLSQNEVENLLSYTNKKIMDSARKLGVEDPYASVINEPILGDEIPKASYVAPECEPCFPPMGSRNVYLMDKWFLDDDEDMETYEGASSKSGGADDA